jgi:mannose-6-phosphate isomerase-like protein (cupin superfamily)
MMSIRRAVDRYRGEQPGVTSWHSFSAGAHYDADNISFGPIVGVDEHLVAPGAGFDWHAHRGVHIVSWVLEGTLRHEDSTGEVRVVEPGMLLVQATGAGIRHTETNGSDTEPLRFVQTTIVGASPASVSLVRPPVHLGGVTIDLVRGSLSIGGSTDAHVLVLAGRHTIGRDPIDLGDSVRVDDGDLEMIDGAGELLVAIVERTNGARDAHS